jgi:LysM repeat protein
VKRGLQSILVRLVRALRPSGRVAVRLFVLPVYRFVVTSRLRIHRLALPARGFALFFISNRYLIHAAIAALTCVTIIANLQGRQALAQDVGQRSLLFAMATEQRNEIVEEEVRPEALVQTSRYLGDATIVGIPHIDFDYDESVDPVTPFMTVPGTIAAQPAETSEGPKAPRTQTETYVVQENDTIGQIAQRFGVNVGTILWNNGLTERQYIRPGDTLKIPPVSGLLVTVKKGDTLTKLASRYDADVAEIASFNNLEPAEQLALGTELVIPGGRPPQIVETRTQIIARSEGQAPRGVSGISSAPKPADLDTKDLPKTRLLWPTPGRVITQYYGWRHTGVDIDGDLTSPLYAAADGVVEKAGWNSGGYGLQVLINHPNGMKTRYAHASKLFVKAGDEVKRGEVIAMMGSTGRSTGSHLHFEVYVNGRRQNPLTYIR